MGGRELDFPCSIAGYRHTYLNVKENASNFWCVEAGPLPTDDKHVGAWAKSGSWVSLEIPTGGSAKGETPLEAAKRELVEETGLTADSWMTLGTVDNSNGVTTDVAHMFLARNLKSGASVPPGDERIELRWMPFADGVRSVMAGGITESVSVAAILKAELLGTSRSRYTP